MSPRLENQLLDKKEKRAMKKLRKDLDSVVYRLGEKSNAFILKEENKEPTSSDIDPVVPFKKLRGWVKWGTQRKKCFDHLSLNERDQASIAMENIIEMRHKVSHGSLFAIKMYHQEYLTAALIVAGPKLVNSRSTRRKVKAVLKRLNRSKLDRLPEFVDYKHRIPKFK